jgi:hypothetical protein
MGRILSKKCYLEFLEDNEREKSEKGSRSGEEEFES